MPNKGLFGGTFDPIHFGHLYIAEEALYKLNLDSILFMPTGNPPHKTDREITEAYIRYELVRMAIKDEERFNLSSFEIDEKGLSYTYKTLDYLKNKEPDTNWFLVTGGDCLMELDSWKNVDEIFKLCTLVVFNRLGYEKGNILKQKKIVEERYNVKIIFLNINPLDISSTNIKKMLKEGRNVNHLLPLNVLNTISELGLYKE
ncbi:nicotinate-nucleotide adenylyltransferase [Candidatus Clostridium radicumherbarum]|uniref:Probable nicotinate-nucleotide adenylyltransferase n=1 Tax=Candidatus Clostridium radicumherbarum TaxID=3381662 RepID=A0ABW8TQ05_9CLOT